MKKLSLVILILIVLVVLMVLRLSNKNIFHKKASSVIELAVSGSNLILENQLKEEFLVVNLDEDKSALTNQLVEIIQIPFDRILEKENLDLLKKPEKKIALYSQNIVLSTKAFTLLNQLGVDNLFIITTENNKETFLYQFQPDTTIRPE